MSKVTETAKALIDETFARCCPQATKPFYQRVTAADERSDHFVIDLVLFDGGLATMMVFKPERIGTYGYGWKSNDGDAFMWQGKSWQRVTERLLAA